MGLAADQCICLRKFEYSETSQILTLFSRGHGVVRVMAKGAHRRTKAGSGRFDGGIDLLDLGEAVFTDDSNRELATLTEWKLREGHLELRKNLRGLYLALYAIELLGALIEEHDPHAEIFDRLESLLPLLGTAAREEIFLAFELDILREAGFLPELNACVSCGTVAENWELAFFAPSRGGLVCRDCEASFPERIGVDVRLLRVLKNVQLSAAAPPPRRLPRLTRHQTDPLNQLLALHMEHALGRRMRMARYVLGRGGSETASGARVAAVNGRT
jgi:DNA repair protein RecO (recombination protein O)